MTRPPRLLASGWIPALLAYVIAVLVMRDSAHVGARDILAFTAWAGWAHTLPGTIVWRAIDWRGRRRAGAGPAGRPLVEDLVLGSMVGIVLTVPTYLVCVAVGAPRLVLLWPLLVLLPAASTRSGRRLLLRRQAEPTPPWWSWALAGVMLYVVYSFQPLWVAEPLSPATLASPYVDEPFHLALVAEFLRHFPAQMPFVEGTPLRYHWLFYPLTSGAAWGSGVEPIVLLRYLMPFALTSLMVFGAAVAAARLSGHRWAAIGAGVVLCLTTSLDVLGWTPATSQLVGGNGWVTAKSPTQALANALCPLLLVLVVGLIRGAAKRPMHWVAAFVTMLFVAGAKSAMLPLFIGGLCGAAIVMLVVRRRPPWVLAALAAMSIAVFGLATVLFYGRGSRATTLEPFQVIERRTEPWALGDGHVSGMLAVVLAIVWLVCLAAPAVGAIGLFTRNGWRRPVPWFLLGTWAVGVTAYLAFRHPSVAQVYFLRSSAVPLALLSALGWARAVGTPTRRRAALVVGSMGAGLAWAFAVAAMTTHEIPNGSGPESDLTVVLVSFWIPIALACVGAAVAVALTVVVGRGGRSGRGAPIVVGISFVLGLCLVAPVARIGAAAPEPRPTRPVIAAGGIATAQWLRDHSDPDDLVATNVHTPLPGGQPDNHRQFWISAYSERRMLVEGWAYIAPETVGLPSTEENNRSGGAPFWKPERLRLNDEVFTAPTRANIAELHDRYGVDWLFVDDRRKPDLEKLRELATERYSDGHFSVFRIGEAGGRPED